MKMTRWSHASVAPPRSSQSAPEYPFQYQRQAASQAASRLTPFQEKATQRLVAGARGGPDWQGWQHRATHTITPACQRAPHWDLIACK